MARIRVTPAAEDFAAEFGQGGQQLRTGQDVFPESLSHLIDRIYSGVTLEHLERIVPFGGKSALDSKIFPAHIQVPYLVLGAPFCQRVATMVLSQFLHAHIDDGGDQFCLERRVSIVIFFGMSSFHHKYYSTNIRCILR